jgi:MSHA biogenesis protein MshM
MYLDHFRLLLQPFSSSPSDCFYQGAGRGETLDALIYVLTRDEEEEGIVLVTGEAGSGKTTLCSQLMKRLPASMQVICRTKTDSSKEELLGSIVEELKIESNEAASARTSAGIAQAPVAICSVEDVLTRISADGRKIVLLVDEAQALTEESLEALSQLCEQDAYPNRLLQVVLFGEAGLECRLRASKMGGVRRRIRCHLALQPLNAKTAAEYLLCRLSVAGHRGSPIFSFDAIRLIARASRGVIRQLNILADKALMAAFRADAPEVGAQHATAAIIDCGIKLRFSQWHDGRNWPGLLNDLLVGASVATSGVVVLVVGMIGWLALQPQPEQISAGGASLGPALNNAPLHLPVAAPTVSLVLPSSPAPLPAPRPVPSAVPAPNHSASVAAIAPNPPPSVSASAPMQNLPPGTKSAGKEPSKEVSAEKAGGARSSVQSQPGPSAERQLERKIAGVDLAGHKLLTQRVDETLKTMARVDKNLYTIQLFDTNNIQPDRMERFLSRARGLVNLSNLYVHLVTEEDQAKFIVTYGLYAGIDEARIAARALPEKYQSEFLPELQTLSELQ